MQKVSLPIDPYLPQIIDSARKTDNLVLTAPPGSGKTTRTPPALLEQFKKIIVLVPRRLAAVSSAARIAEENNLRLGDEVGYQVRFENKTTAQTRLIFMTVGVFVKKLNDDSMWNGLEMVVFDEFHERSSQMDIALGICYEKQILGEKLKLLVMSATLNAEKLLKFLNPAELINIEDKPFTLELIKSKKAQRLICDFHFYDELCDTMALAVQKSKKDILVFLPGLGEIRGAERQLSAKFRNFEFCILHGSVSLSEQRKVITPGVGRRIILSTNVAESSVTIPSVDCVIDCGLEKKSASELKIGFKRLEIVRISKFSAKQRAGRAARTGPGTCLQMWHEADEMSMPLQIIPEIIKSDLLEETLTLLAAGVDTPEHFSWLDKPQRKFSEALEQLKIWNLLGSDQQFSATGKLVQQVPLDVEKSVMFVNLGYAGYQNEACTLLAFLETTSFDRLAELPLLTALELNEQGHRIAAQLKRISVPSNSNSEKDFRSVLIEIFFELFPHRIAKRKDSKHALSSRGRGVELSPALASDQSDYFLLLAGRELNSSLTKCEFGIGFSAEEFDAFSADNVKTLHEYGYDFEKGRMYSLEQKMSGLFVLSEAKKVYIDEAGNPAAFKLFFTDHFAELLERHPHYVKFSSKLDFLRKKTSHEFLFAEDLHHKIFESVGSSVATVAEFFELKLFEILLFVTPNEIKTDLLALPDHFVLPRGKTLEIDYTSEQAPKISARLQEFYGLQKNPTVLHGRIRMTLEMLAPNNRPTQITSQLENFWQSGYAEIKKELKARYPKHAWPDDPAHFMCEIFKKRQ